MVDKNIPSVEKVELYPEDLYNFKEKLEKKLREKYCEKCVPEKGLILNLQIDRVISDTVSRINSYPNFIVHFTIKSLKPEKGTKTSVKVSIVHQNYIIGCIHEKITVMIPGSNLSESGYTYTEKGYQKGKGKGKIFIKINSVINVEITNIKYKEDKEIMCIAKI